MSKPLPEHPLLTAAAGAPQNFCFESSQSVQAHPRVPSHAQHPRVSSGIPLAPTICKSFKRPGPGGDATRIGVTPATVIYIHLNGWHRATQTLLRPPPLLPPRCVWILSRWDRDDGPQPTQGPRRNRAWICNGASAPRAELGFEAVGLFYEFLEQL